MHARASDGRVDRVRMRPRRHNPTDSQGVGRDDGFMRTLHYMGETVLLDDDVCQALLRYAQALADTKRSDVVTIPFIAADGTPAAAEFLLGPASQLYATPAPDQPHRADNAGTVEDLDERTRLLHPNALIGPVASAPPADTYLADDW